MLRRRLSAHGAVSETVAVPDLGVRGASGAFRSFNRYEIKYLIPERDVPRLREELAARMEPDTFGADGAYGVYSVYYDTTDLRFYWEKIEGIRFRRKLRLRHYGDASEADDSAPAFVEIKQRVNRVTQKRRIRLPLADARRLCAGDVSVEHHPEQQAFVHEVGRLVGSLSLRPIATTGYRREAYIGRQADFGLRVTIDHRIVGRDRDFHPAAGTENRFIVPRGTCVVEVKANERVPYWVTDLTARSNLSVVRISKYCQSVEVFDRAPRSRFHVHDHAGNQAVYHKQGA
ncbi:polyphosphate polymerase domain-containing protein [Nocardioidaceae bacterium SCSIO 66511]|nr:polyphosphate polymerase domain-containing protein [Nocardioidaceae bacterium SCSIO 66511]